MWHDEDGARGNTAGRNGRTAGDGADITRSRQFEWLEKGLNASSSRWKIAVFHHPLYSSGDRHGSDLRLREVLEPFFVTYNVSVVFTGHDHSYERVKPQQGITYFVVGSGGQLRVGNIDRGTGITAKGFDTDQAFMAAEIAGDQMYFNTIARLGQTVDSGVVMAARSRTERETDVCARHPRALFSCGTPTAGCSERYSRDPARPLIVRPCIATTAPNQLPRTFPPWPARYVSPMPSRSGQGSWRAPETSDVRKGTASICPDRL